MKHETKIVGGVTILFLSLFIALAAAITSLVLINRVNETAQDLIQLRKEGNTAICVASNVSRLAIRTAIKDSLLALVPPGTTLTDVQKATIARYNEKVDSLLPYRDCSPEGIEEFLKNVPPDPALEKP